MDKEEKEERRKKTETEREGEELGIVFVLPRVKPMIDFIILVMT